MACADSVQAEGPGGIPQQAPGQEVHRIRLAHSARQIIDRGGEKQDRKDLAGFAGLRASEILEIEGIARADPLKDLGNEFPFMRIRNFRQILRKDRYTWQSQPLRKPFWIRISR